VHQKRPLTRFAFVFDLPSDVEPKPTTLLQAIENDDPSVRPTLGQRFRIARSLAETLFQFHSVGWLHKSIRSENILLFPHPQNPNDDHNRQQIDYSRPYLMGFEFSRDILDRSNTEQDGLLKRNLYRHPDRQGSPSDEKDPDRPFTLLHDIYALGVVLLEVGLWRATMGYENWDTATPADEIQHSLEEHAKQRLPHYMGQAYTDLVVACLQGSFGDEDQVGGALNDIEREKIQLAFYRALVAGIESGLTLK
jgi:serine/threonine protein kinase